MPGLASASWRAIGGGFGTSSLPNLRDAGGHPTRQGGRVRSGILYRSGAPSRLQPVAIAALAELGIRQAIDLRSPAERAVAPVSLPQGVVPMPIDVLADASGLTPTLLERLLADPAMVGAALAGRTGAEVSERRFRDFVALESACRGYGNVMMSLAGEVGRPALIHCSTGKDRTGWAVAILLTLLDVPRQHVMADFLLSAELLEPVLEPARRAFVARGGVSETFDSLSGVRPQNLDAAFDEALCEYGSIDGYIERGLGIGVATRGALREAFVEDPVG